MLIVDGHQSHLDPKFVDYINSKKHPCKVCLGVPYATILWQVGDALEQNGKFKIEWTKVKEWMMVYKSINCLPCTIGPTDIIPLINRVFHKFYGNVNSNLKALADRGWNPLNRKLLEHKELIDDSAPVIQHALTTSTHNSDVHSAGTISFVLVDFVEQCLLLKTKGVVSVAIELLVAQAAEVANTR